MISKNIKNLIFDLGGVILDLSVDHTLQAFTNLSGLNKEEVLTIYQAAPGFEDYERGALTDGQFRDFIREAYNLQATDQEINGCWNAMLRALPLVKLQLLKKLMNSYTVTLLSNTNAIHLDYINHTILPGVTEAQSLDAFFHRTYYSHLMGMRKPEVGIFEQVLKENNFNAEQTLFLDDNEFNIEGAKSIGIDTIHITHPDLILEVFS